MRYNRGVMEITRQVTMLRRAGAYPYSARPHGGGPLHIALAALRILGALGVGLILGASAVRTVGEISLDPGGMLVPIIIYAVIGGAILVVASPRVGVFLLLGWVAPWLLVGLVVATDAVWVPFAGIITALYVLALGVACYRTGHRSQVKGTA
jgi:hypothetical protein